eukprot:g4500.t1
MAVVLKETLKNDNSVKQHITEYVRHSSSLREALQEQQQRSLRSPRVLSHREEHRLVNRITGEVETKIPEYFTERIDHILNDDLTHPVSRMIQDRIQSKTEEYYKIFSKDEILKCFPSSMISYSPSPLKEDGLELESVNKQTRKRRREDALPDPLSPGEEEKSSELFTSSMYEGYLRGHYDRDTAVLTPSKNDTRHRLSEGQRDDRQGPKWRHGHRWHRS